MYDIGISTFFLISSSPVIKWIQFLLCIRDLTSYGTKPAMRERATHPVIYTYANSGDIIRRAQLSLPKLNVYNQCRCFITIGSVDEDPSL